MKAKIEIKPARPDDARAIASVLAESFAEYEPLYTAEAFAATTPNSDVLETRFAEGPIWIALFEGKIVGTISVVPEDESLYIRSMAILPEARGAGIGEQLLTEIENFAVAGGYRRLFLSTTPFLYHAIGLYGKFGFVRSGVDDLYGTSLLTMSKHLSRISKE